MRYINKYIKELNEAYQEMRPKVFEYLETHLINTNDDNKFAKELVEGVLPKYINNCKILDAWWKDNTLIEFDIIFPTESVKTLVSPARLQYIF